MGYGKGLPVTGGAMLTLGGVGIKYPYLAVGLALVVVGGFLALRLARPAKSHRRLAKSNSR